MTMPFGHRQVARPDGSGPDAWWGYECAYCGRQTTGAVLAYMESGKGPRVRWVQCSACQEPSVVDSNGTVSPGASFGPNLDGLPREVEEAYEEARRCMAIGAEIAAEGMCRKILMHVAVEKGAVEGKKFVEYIGYLKAEGYLTKPMKGWVDLIRTTGNDANHKLEPRDRSRAERILQFTAHLLRSVYEMEHLAKQHAPRATP